MLLETSIDVLQAAMRGLSAREDAIGNNIANVNTPYFTARTVSFENELRQAISNGDNPLTSRVRTGMSTSAAGLNGNNVNLADETVLGIETQMKMQLALRATGDRFSLLRSAVRGA
jgi:flagellar basal-body rod protein FlgB